MNQHIINKAKRVMDKADQLCAVFLLGCAIAITPLYCSASVIKAHTHARDVPMLSPMSAAVLTKALTPLRTAKLMPVMLRLPPTLPRRGR